MNLKEIVDRTTKFFKDKNIESARLDTELLISNALGLRRIDLYLKFEQPLKESELEKCREFVRRRAQGEPIAYILGQKDFYNLTFSVDSRVLIPRPETETLVEIALTWMRTKNFEKYKVLDLGAGSGCIGLTIAANEPRSQVTLVDVSEGAIELLRNNREKLGLINNSEIIHSRIQDLDLDLALDLKEKKWDIIVANPPYISSQDLMIQENVKKYEPALALFAENDGMKEIIEWSEKVAKHLQKPGVMIFEIGMSQGDLSKKHFESLGIFDRISILKDLSGLNRFVVGERL